MLSLRKRFGASIALTFLSIASIILLLPTDKLSQLQKISLVDSIDDYADLWKWGVDEDEEDSVENAGDGIRLVVFGDSWVDDVVENGVKGRGKSWPQVLCEEINCTSRLSFSASQPSSAYLEDSPIGVYTSHVVHKWAQSKTSFLPLESNPPELLPDLATQVKTFISLPVPKSPPKDTIFVFSFGFWDIYDFARLDYAVAQNATDDSIKEFFSQLDILFNHFTRKLYPAVTSINASSAEEPQFKVVFPKLFDPTLTPGWSSLRPIPMKPSSVAEQQKNAVYLTQRWNQQLENSVGPWLDSVLFGLPAHSVAPESPAPTPSSTSEPNTPDPTSNVELTPKEDQRFIEKDVFFYDLERTLLDLMVEHQMEAESLVDANGLGTGESPFDSVVIPCLHTAEDGEDVSGMKDVNGLLICKQPDDFLWWDAWNVGGVVNRMVGKGIAEKIAAGKGLRSQWGGDFDD